MAPALARARRPAAAAQRTQRPGRRGQTLSGDRRPEPGGWNRFQLEVDDVDREAERLRAAGVTLRSDIIRGIGGDQVLVEDPSGNPVELFAAKSPSGPPRNSPAFAGPSPGT